MRSNKLGTLEFERNSLLRVLRSFGEINLDYFSERLRLQKLGYLSQKLSGNEEYSYSWYIHGPYSTSLTSDLFTGDEMGLFEKDVELNDKEKEVSKLLRILLEGEVNDPNFLELYASIWYLMPKGKLSEDEGKSIADILCKEKPQFSGTEIKTAMGKIISFREKYNF